ncbi:MAG: hypothetical protein HY816_14350 [Candidatus Wallbacteria bacterium]|nr:hypothetical protein [Candidatus Wallbacteria bacterium]
MTRSSLPLPALALIAVTLLTTLPVLGADDAPAAVAAELARPAAGREIASFSVPELSLRLARKMAKALVSEAGVLRALPNLSQKQLDVEFVVGATSPKALLNVLAGIDKATKLLGVHSIGASAGSPSKCDGCPLKGACTGKER